MMSSTFFYLLTSKVRDRRRKGPLQLCLSMSPSGFAAIRTQRYILTEGGCVHCRLSQNLGSRIAQGVGARRPLRSYCKTKRSGKAEFGLNYTFRTWTMNSDQLAPKCLTIIRYYSSLSLPCPVFLLEIAMEHRISALNLQNTTARYCI